MALFSIRSARLNEKPTWGQVWRRVLTQVFGLEGLHDNYYGAYHLNGSVKETGSNISVSVLSKIKLYTPLKLLIEFPLTFLHDFADRVCQMGADEPEIYEDEGDNTEFPYVTANYGVIRTSIRWIVGTIFGLPLAIAKHFTSPFNTIIRPLVQEAQHHPGRFLLLVAGVALLTFIIAAGVFTGGLAGAGALAVIPGAGKLITILSFVPGATQLAAISGMLSSTISGAISGTTMALFGVSLPWIGLAIQIGFVITTAVAALSIFPQIVPQIRDKITLGATLFTKAEFRAEGIETAWQYFDSEKTMPYRGKDCGQFSKIMKETTFSRLHFHTAGNDYDGMPVKGLKPSDHTAGYAWGSFFGLFGTIDGPSAKEYYAYRQKHQQQSAVSVTAPNKVDGPLFIHLSM